MGLPHCAPREYGPVGPTPSRAARTKKDLVTPFLIKLHELGWKVEHYLAFLFPTSFPGALRGALAAFCCSRWRAGALGAWPRTASLGVVECRAPVLWQKGPWGITGWPCPHHLRSVPCHHPFSWAILSFNSYSVWLPRVPHCSCSSSEGGEGAG